MMDSIGSDGRDASPPDQPVSFLILDLSGMIDDATAKILFSQQASIQITKNMQQVTDALIQYPFNHRAIITYVEDIEQLLIEIKLPPETDLITYIIIVGDKTKKENTIFDLFDIERPK